MGEPLAELPMKAFYSSLGGSFLFFSPEPSNGHMKVERVVAIFFLHRKYFASASLCLKSLFAFLSVTTMEVIPLS